MKRISALFGLVFLFLIVPSSFALSVGGSIPDIDIGFNDSSSRSLEQYFYNSSSANLSVSFDHPILSNDSVVLSRNQSFVSDVLDVSVSSGGVLVVSSGDVGISYFSPVLVNFSSGNLSSYQSFDLVVGSPSNELFAPISLDTFPIVFLLVVISVGALYAGKVNYGIPMFWFFVLSILLIASDVHFLFVVVTLFATVFSLYNIKN